MVLLLSRLLRQLHAIVVVLLLVVVVKSSDNLCLFVSSTTKRSAAATTRQVEAFTITVKSNIRHSLLVPKHNNRSRRKRMSTLLFASTKGSTNFFEEFTTNLFSSTNPKDKQTSQVADSSKNKIKLFELLAQTPNNQATSLELTNEILNVVQLLEAQQDQDDFTLEKLSGNWELLWTAQDVTSKEYQQSNPFRRWINPLENQSYSNNPSAATATTMTSSSSKGRSNPILPRNVQDQLEQWNILETSTSQNENTSSDAVVVSTQSIDLMKQRVRNVVSFTLPSSSPLTKLLQTMGNKKKNKRIRGSLTVDVAFEPNSQIASRIDVKFDSCRINIPSLGVNWNIPLGIIGPTGWLQTNYIDDNLRITRGHKGSVFILTRPSSSSGLR